MSDLGSATPCPGGGSAAALVAATAAALVLMVVGINLKREGGQKSASRELSRALSRLRGLVDEDARAYQRISGFGKESRGTREYQSALKNGVKIPLQICEACPSILEFAFKEKQRTGRWLLSDLLEAAILCKAAFKSARLNIEVNLGGIKDEKYSRRINLELAEMERRLGRYDFPERIL